MIMFSVMFESNTNILYRLFDQGRRCSFKLIENIIQVVIEDVRKYTTKASSLLEKIET